VSVPVRCCSAPRAVRMMALRALPSASTVSCNSRTGTPVIRSTKSGQYPRNRAAYGVKTVGTTGDVGLVNEPTTDGKVEQSVGEREVGAGRDL